MEVILSVSLPRPGLGLRWQVKEQPGVTAVASLTPGHVIRAWYSSTCLSKPSSWPLFICKMSVFLSDLHLCFLGTLDAINLVYSILQKGNLPKVPDLVRGTQTASHPPQSHLWE